MIVLSFLFFGMSSCVAPTSVRQTKQIEWTNTKAERDGFSLQISYPLYTNVERFQNKYTTLLCVIYKLEKVESTGLPNKSYDRSLFDFQIDMSELMDSTKDEGIILLVETFDGHRNYWYYISSSTDYKDKIDKIKQQYPFKVLNVVIRDDKDWEFLKTYPVKLYWK